MNKKIDNNIIYSEADGIFTYIPSFLDEEKINIIIKDAVLRLKVTFGVSVGGNGFKILHVVSPQKSEVIDHITNAGLDGFICIDIADALNEALKTGKNSLKFKIEGGSFTFDQNGKEIVIEYLSKKENVNGSTSQEVDIKRAGTVQVNLASGDLKLCHANVSEGEILPVQIGHIFNSINKNKNNDEVAVNGSTKSLPDFCMGQGWKLNAQQYLVKQRDIDKNFSDKETSGKFTLIDGSGDHIVFIEKYFYMDNTDKKVYLTISQIEIGLTGELTYKDVDGKIHNVTKEVLSESGLTLSAKLEGFKGIELLNQDIEDVANLKENIKGIKAAVDELKESISLNNQQIVLMGLTKHVLFKQTESQKTDIAMNTDYIDLQNKLTQIHKLHLQDSRDWKDQAWAASYLGGEKENFTKEKIDKIFNYDPNNSNTFIKIPAGTLTEKDIKKLRLNLSNEESTIYTLGIDYTGNTHGSLKMQKNSNGLTKEIYIDEISADTFKDYVLKQLSETDLQNNSLDEAFKKILNNRVGLTLSMKDLISLEMQIEEAFNKNKKYNEKIIEYSEQLLKKEHDLSKLEEQVPLNYISDESGKILGFGPTSDCEIFRLIFIGDAYENAIVLKYEDDKLIHIITDDDKTIYFEYKDDKLVSISDSQNRKTEYGYSDNKLTKIIYPNRTISKYSYDVNGNLISAVDPSGYGANFNYLNGQVTKIGEISSASKIDGKGKINFEGNENDLQIGGEYFQTNSLFSINYSDIHSTVVTNLKTNKNTTYIFNELGKPITIYQNEIEGAVFGNVYAKSFNRDGDKKAFTIEALKNVENLLNSGKFEGYEQKFISDFYLGDDLYCGSDIYPSSYRIETYDDDLKQTYTIKEQLCGNAILSRVVDIEKIKAIKATDFVLSGWAKADAAWVNRRLTDYCGKCENTNLDDNEIANMIEASADSNKKARRFELRAELKYFNNGIERMVEQFCSFDWMNTGWQYCAFPVTLSENPSDELVEMKVYFDYSRNTGDAIFFGISLCEGKWEYTEFEDKRKIYSESSDSEYITRYEYDDKRPSKAILIDKSGKEFVTEYSYNAQGSPIRTVDFNGIVSENEYNDKGQIIKSYTYHKDTPSAKIYDKEEQLDEKGKTTGEVNEFGEHVLSYEKTPVGLVSKTKDNNGNVVAYGYDYSDDTLLSTSTTVDDETNENVFGYTFDMLTSLTHNDTKFAFEYDGFGRTTKIEVAGKLYAEIDNQKDNLSRTKLANGEVFQTITNEEGNVTKVSELFADNYNETTEKVILENFYDTYGNLNCTKDYTSGEAVEYGILLDKHGRVSEKTYTQNGKKIKLSNTFNKHGSVETTTEKIGTCERGYSYDYENSPNAELCSVELPNGYIQKPSYDPLGRIVATKIDSLDGSLYSKNYNFLQKGDHASNLVISEWFGQNGSIKNSLKYSYDEKGNIISVKENGLLVNSYTYDSLSRLVREDNKKLNKTFTYEYDKGGNILRKIEYNYTTDRLDNKNAVNDIPYTYPTFGWRDQLLSFNGESCKYDELGNPEVYRGKQLVWERGRNLVDYNGIKYSYNASGIRIKKTVLGLTTNFYLDGSKILAQETAGKMLHFNYGMDGVIGFTYDSEYFYKKNIQGDVIGILNANGVEIVKYVYDAWGNHETYVLNNGSYVNLSTLTQYNKNELNKAIAEINPFRYRGYYYDTETGLYYLQTRYYDPETGRFINADALEYLDKENINGLNLFAYCNNNSVMNMDCTGRFPANFDISAFWNKITSALEVVAVSALMFLKGLAVNKNRDDLMSLIDFKWAKNAAKIMKWVGYISVVIDTIGGVINNISNGTQPVKIITDSIIDVSVGVGSIWLMGYIGSMLGTFVPVIGNAIGALVGIGVGILIYSAKDFINEVKETVYNIAEYVVKSWKDFWSFKWLK